MFKPPPNILALVPSFVSGRFLSLCSLLISKSLIVWAKTLTKEGL